MPQIIAPGTTPFIFIRSSVIKTSTYKTITSWTPQWAIQRLGCSFPAWFQQLAAAFHTRQPVHLCKQQKDTIPLASQKKRLTSQLSRINSWVRVPQTSRLGALLMFVDSPLSFSKLTTAAAHAHNRDNPAALPRASRSWPMRLEEIIVKKSEEMKVMLKSIHSRSET